MRPRHALQKKAKIYKGLVNISFPAELTSAREYSCPRGSHDFKMRHQLTIKVNAYEYSYLEASNALSYQ